MKKVEIFTDGACRGNPGPGGYGSIIRIKGKAEEFRGSAEKTTNNIMELTAAIVALNQLKEPCEVMLHGDLHHENILLDEQRGWLAIDPKGVIGPRAYQPARFLNNRLPEGSSEKHADMTRLRLDILSEILDCPSATLAAAAFLDRILGTSWSLEDEGTFDMAPALANAHMLQRFL